MQPFARRETLTAESFGTLPVDPNQDQNKGYSNASNNYDDYLFKPAKIAVEMYQPKPSGIHASTHIPYHPHGGIVDNVARLNQNTAKNPEHLFDVNEPSAIVEPARNGVMLPLFNYFPGNAMNQVITDIEEGMQARRKSNVMSMEEVQPIATNIETVNKVDVGVEDVALQKRIRNRISQKKYRDRKKNETTKINDKLSVHKNRLTKMERQNINVVEEHTRNAMMRGLLESKNLEIAMLKQVLMELKQGNDNGEGSANCDDSSTCSESSNDNSASTSSFGTNPFSSIFEDGEEQSQVTDIVGRKFVDDRFNHVVKDLKDEAYGHVHCERRMPVLVNLVRERFSRSQHNEGSLHSRRRGESL